MSELFSSIFKSYTVEDYLNLIDKVEKSFEDERNLIFIPKGEVLIVGDLHGDLFTLEKIIEKFFQEKFDFLLFLGDYVDRGAKQVEVVNILFHYKVNFPKKIILIRGNHEDPIINKQYGFYDELHLKFRKNYKEMFRRYNNAFSRLPLAAITWNRIFCVHGGIPEGLDDIQSINALPSQKEGIKNPIIRQLLWNDPHKRAKTFRSNMRGPGIMSFGKDAFISFITQNSIKYIIRSHEKFKNGYKKFFDDKLISIFSSQSYSKLNSTVVGILKKSGFIDIIPI